MASRFAPQKGALRSSFIAVTCAAILGGCAHAPAPMSNLFFTHDPDDVRLKDQRFTKDERETILDILDDVKDSYVLRGREKDVIDGFFAYDPRTKKAEAVTYSPAQPGQVYSQDEFDDRINYALSLLDAHSRYENPQEARDAEEQEEGHFQGVGLELGIRDKMPYITEVMQGYPGEKAGLKVGDVITHVHDEARHLDYDTKSVTLTNAVKGIKGPEGSTVTLSVLRGSDTLSIDVTREEVKTHATTYRMIGKTGYIKITKFDETTEPGFMEAVNAIQAAGGEDYILDLRGNPGGRVDKAAEIVGDIAIEDAAPIILKGRSAEHVTTYNIVGHDRLKKARVIVLTSPGSASAAEIVSASLQNLRRALIVGEGTFGKGSAQQGYPVGNDGKVYLTVALYYPPPRVQPAAHESAERVSPQLHGVTPDVLYLYNQQRKNELMDVFNDDKRSSPDGTLPYSESMLGHVLHPELSGASNGIQVQRTCALKPDVTVRTAPPDFVTTAFIKAGEDRIGVPRVDGQLACALYELGKEQNLVHEAPYSGEALRWFEQHPRLASPQR